MSARSAFPVPPARPAARRFAAVLMPRAFAAALLLATGAAGAAGAGPDITSVWRSTLSCGGAGHPTTDAMSRDPDAESIRRGHIVTLPAQRLQFQVPVLPGAQQVVVRLAFDDHSRGVTDQYLLFADADLAPPLAAVVVTDLPKAIATREQAFESVTGLQRQLAAGTGAYPSFGRIDGPYGESLEVIVPGRVSSACFPTARFATAARTPGGVPFGISRFAFVAGRLVEFSMALTMPAQMTLEDQHARARALMDDFWGGLSTL